MRDIAKSIRGRLLYLAKIIKVDYNLILIRFFHERFLYRLSISPYRNNFYLKGGALLYALDTKFPRPTIDIDLLGIKIKNEQNNLLNIFTEICLIEFLEDGVVFDSRSIKTVEININRKYQGIRISLVAILDSIRQSLQIDIGFGDNLTMQMISYPKLIDNLPSADICAYPAEYIIAEKFHAMFFLSELNSRYKDFYDVYRLFLQNEINEKNLTEAIRTTFHRRETKFSTNHPLFSDVFAKDPNRNLQWHYFLKKIKHSETLTFETVMSLIKSKLQPIIENEGKAI